MADFHFIRPLWLLGFVGLLLLIWQLKKLRVSSSAWHKVIPKHLTTQLLANDDNKKPLSLMIPFIIGVLIITALAGPTWKKLPQPVFEVERGSVIIMDMSFSMLATDLKPNRLTRARFKAMALVEQINEGEIGLIAYAGDAFTISPLTADINNINLLLPSLAPDIMPELGSNPYPALILANQMLINAGHIKGDIYWVTDGIDMDELQDINDFIGDHNHRVNILGVGTEQGAPITLSNGELMKDRGGNIVIPKMNAKLLTGIADRSDGKFSAIRPDDSDITYLGERPAMQTKDMQAQQDNLGDQWQETGPYLLLLVLPLMLGYFRRGVLFTPALLCMLSYSLIYTPKAEANIWDDLWQTQNQQASDKFGKQQYQDAAEQFNDSLWKASSYYQAADYENALKEYQKVASTASNYNQGNTLAKLGQLDEAIARYDDVLSVEPEHADALANKALVEQLKQQQEQEQEQEQEQSDDQQQNDDQQEQNQENEDQQQGENGQQGEQSDDPQQQNNDSQPDDGQSEDNQSEPQNSNDEDSEQQNKDNEQQNAEQNQQDKEQEKQAAAQAENAEQNEQESNTEEQMAGMTDSESNENSEENQKHEQLLRKVTDDPYLLLRNKMKLEYQKRRQTRSSIGVKEKW